MCITYTNIKHFILTSLKLTKTIKFICSFFSVSISKEKTNNTNKTMERILNVVGIHQLF